MRPGTVILAGILSAALGFAVQASHAGYGVPVPEKNPPSIREGSVRGPLRSGRTRTRYFVGGGIHRGK